MNLIFNPPYHHITKWLCWKEKTCKNSQHETFCMLLVIDNVFNKQLKILPFVSATQTKHIKRNERKPIMIIKSVTRHKVFKYSYQNFSRISIWEIKTPVLLIMSYTEHMHLSISFWLLIGCSYCLRMLSIYEPDTVMLSSGSQFISQ